MVTTHRTVVSVGERPPTPIAAPECVSPNNALRSSLTSGRPSARKDTPRGYLRDTRAGYTLGLWTHRTPPPRAWTTNRAGRPAPPATSTATPPTRTPTSSG